MDFTGRPAINDFLDRLDEPFAVIHASGTPVGEWKLLQCKPLQAADIPELEGMDCFSLLFEAAPSEQGTYQITADDGTRHVIFATPVGPDRMEVIVN